MSTAYETTGRVRQKQRTRQALISAARELIAEGRTPTVEDAADAAGTSRTTAYRYFANQAALLAASHPEIERTSLLPTAHEAPVGVHDRLRAVVEAFTDLILDTEAQQRATLRVSLAVDPRAEPLALRQGRAIGWYAEALEPLRGQLPEEALTRLVLAIRSATGIESLVWLTDVAGCSRPEAAELMRWSAMAMLDAALRQGGVPGSPDTPD